MMGILKLVPFLALAVAAADSFCSSQYPAAPCISVTTVTVKVSSPKTVATATVTTETDTRTTVVATATVTTTTGVVTVTSTTGTITTSIATSTSTATVTSGTTIECVYFNNKRGLEDPLHNLPVVGAMKEPLGRFDRRATTTQNPLASLLSNLIALPTNIGKTACSCITESKPCSTSTATTSSVVTLSVTATSSVAASTVISRTTTTTFNAESTTRVNVQDTSTIEYEATTTVTAKETERRGCGCWNQCDGCNSKTGCVTYTECSKKGENPGPVLRQIHTISDPACLNYCCSFADCGAWQWRASDLLCETYAVGDEPTTFSNDPDYAYGLVQSRDPARL